MKGNKQTMPYSARKEKVKKTDDLCGWHQKEESFLLDEIGIDTWFEDRKQSGAEAGHVCALAESFERQRQHEHEKAQLKIRISSSRKSDNVTNTTSSNHSSASKRDSDVDILLQGNMYSTLIGSSDNHVALDQSEVLADDTLQEDTDWSRSFVFHPKQARTPIKESFPPSQNFALADLMRYEERLKKRRENRLRKSMENFEKIEMADSVSPKIPATIASVTFAQGMIQPISGQTESKKRSANQKSYSKTKLPSLLTEDSEQNLTKFETSPRTSNCDLPNESNAAKSRKETNGTNSYRNNCSKFNFDILEKYALIRNAKKKATFTDYVKRIRSLQNDNPVNTEHSFSDSETENVLKEETRYSREFRSVLKVPKGHSLTFEKVRELWYESQKDSLASHVSRRSKCLSSHGDIVGNLMILDVKRNRCSSEPPKNEKEAKSFLSLKGKSRNSKHTCPLQRMLSATNRRLEANQLDRSKRNKVKLKRNNTENEFVEMTRTKNGIKCCILGRSSGSSSHDQQKEPE